MEVKVGDWQLIRELERRIESKSIFRAKNGRLWPRYCPVCGGTLTEYGVGINYGPKEVEVFDFEQWKHITRDIIDKEGLYLPDIPFRRTGKFYFVRCDNTTNDCDPCPVNNFDWFKDLDEARQDFFTTAEDFI